MMISRIDISLSISPHFEQVRLQSFELAAHSFHVALDVFLRTISIFEQERQSPSTIERNQSLDNMVSTDDGFVIRSRELEYGLGPQVRWVIELPDFKNR